MERRIATVLILGLALLVAACSSPEPANTTASAGGDPTTTVPADGSTGSSDSPSTTDGASETTSPPVSGNSGPIVVGQAGEMTSFDPYYISQENRLIHFQVFDPLVVLQTDGTAQPHLVESWELSEDGQVMTLHLRDDVVFHNGRELTAEDVVANLERARDDSIGHSLALSASGISDVVAVNDYTVEIHYVAGTPEGVALDLLGAIFIIAPEAFETVATDPIGTGPFVLEEFRPGQGVTLIRNEDYWGEVASPSIEVRTFADPATLNVNMLAGDIHIGRGFAESDVAQMKERDGFTVFDEQVLGRTWAIAFNTTHPPFDDPRVRQALAYAVDRETIVQNVFFGLSIPTSSPFYIEGSPLYKEEDLTRYQFDLDKAADLLAEAGVEDLSFVASYSSNNPQTGLYLQIVQMDLAKIGVNMSIEAREAATATTRFLDGDFEVMAWPMAHAPRDVGRGFAANSMLRGDDGNSTQYSGERYQELSRMAVVELDPEARLDMYREMRDILMEEQWFIAVASGGTPYVLADGVTGFENTPSDFPRLAAVSAG